MPDQDALAKVTRRCRNLANTNAVTEYEADLTSEDRKKQKEAVRKYLANKIRNDWIFDWPPKPEELLIGSQASITSGEDDDNLSEEDEWKEREEWLSNASELGDNQDTLMSETDPENGKNIFNKLSAFRRRQKESLLQELTWNDGLRCFIARRNAWTCARVRHKPVPTYSPEKPPSNSLKEATDDEIKQDGDKLEMEEVIEIPIGRPILPAENLVRSSITPRSYSFIYDKVVLNSVTPTCPINLRDIIQSCIQGWKRDGQWPVPTNDLVKELPQKQSGERAIENLFPKNGSDEAASCEENIEKRLERGEVQRQKQKRGFEIEANDPKDRRKGLSSCFNRILGRGL
ncbi:hypothetical protein Golomagni_00222 [Golovinomyces magnicellulatus]|nr:hypothetical protein Golomagni_00222 [Golovinomyces magnicellulatus]